MKFEFFSKILMCNMWANNPDFTEDERLAAMYAFHVWRERVDVWEYATALNRYDTFVSAYELERYIVNPWLRASSWIKSPAVNLMDLPILNKFDMGGIKIGPLNARKTRVERTAETFQYCVNQVPNWWASQKESVKFSPVPELTLATLGYVSAAQLVDPSDPSTKLARDRLIEGAWHPVLDDRRVEALRVGCFSWQEFIDRAAELRDVIPGLIGMMITMGGRGASLGDGFKEVARRPESSAWTNERKLLNRLAKRVDTLRRYADAIAEVALTQIKD